MSEMVEKLRAATGVTLDFPKPGVNFIDITTVLERPQINNVAVAAVQELFDPDSYDVIVSPGARGWLLAQPLALALEKPCIPARDPKKLPRETVSIESQSEYGITTLALHRDSITPDLRVLIVDDALATCGTAAALIKLLRSLGAKVIGVAALYDLQYLPKVELPCPARAVVPYPEPPAPYTPEPYTPAV